MAAAQLVDLLALALYGGVHLVLSSSIVGPHHLGVKDLAAAGIDVVDQVDATEAVKAR